MLSACYDRVEADLRRFYNVRLSGIYDGSEDVIEVSNMVAHMPRGGAIGEWLGGPMAVTAEVEALWENTYILTAVNSEKPKKVKPREFPEGIRTIQEREARKAKHATRMAEKFRAKYGAK